MKRILMISLLTIVETNINISNSEEYNANVSQQNVVVSKQNVDISQKNTDTTQQHVDANQQHIGANQQNVGANQQNVDANQQNIDANQQNVGANQQYVGANQQNIDDSGQAINVNSQNISDNIIYNNQYPNKILTNINTNGNIMNQQNNVNNYALHTNNEQVTDSLIKKADDLLVGLYPNNSYGLFNNPKEIDKTDQNSLRVDFKLTKEICEAILNKQAETLKNILLNPDKQFLGVYEDILGKHIEHMVKEFNNIDDLKCMINYLIITGGKSTYTPVSSIKSWLNSIKCIDEIQEIAKLFLEENEDNNIIVQSYELRISLYFKTGNHSKICVPKAEQLSLLTNLNEIENNINEILDSRKKQLNQYQDIMPIVNLQNEIKILKKDKNIIKLENINKTINKKEEEKTSLNAKKDEEIKRVPKIAKSSRRSTIYAEDTTKINQVKKEYDDKITVLDKELEELNKQRLNIEEKCKQVNEQIKEKEKQLKNMNISDDNKNKIGFVNVIIETGNKNIIKELDRAKVLFNNNIRNDGNNK